MSTPQTRLCAPASAAGIVGRCHAFKQAQAAVDAYVSGQRM